MNETQNIQKSSEGTKPENPPNPDNTASQPQLIEPPQTTPIEEPSATHQPAAMEVHPHHPHLKRKHFKEYFLEFIMMFLAVTLGFFAENLRERISNREKERHYMQTFVRDLQDDTANLSRALVQQRILLRKMDSAVQIPTAALNEVAKQDSFYHYFIYFYTWADYFTRNDNTLQQLRNAGGFNLITKSGVVDSIESNIALYEFGVKDNGDYYVDCYKKVVDLGTQLMKLPEPPIHKKDPAFTVFPNGVVVFNPHTEAQLEQFYSWIRGEKGALNLYMLREAEYKQRCVQLMQYLNAKYNE